MIFMKINFKKLNFGQLILVKISETAATRQHKIILKLKCTKLDFGWGSSAENARSASTHVGGMDNR